MAVAVTCKCGANYALKDEFAGHTVTCPTCGGVNRVPSPAEAPALHPAFDRDVFLLRQQHLSLSDKYFVWSESGEQLLFVRRPLHLAKNGLAFVVAFIAAFVVYGFLSSVADSLYQVPVLAALLSIGAVVAAIVAGVGAFGWLSEKRHVSFHAEKEHGPKVLEVLQNEKVAFLVATYTVKDPSGRLLATFRKNYLYDLFRKRWTVFGADGSVLCVAKEDSVLKAMLRRVLGPMLGLLRTNFVFLDAATTSPLGALQRKMTILDRYSLDLRNDVQRRLDRRVAVALGVMLDTGERR